MGSFEKERRRPDRPPAWRSSEGRMWEKTPEEKREGKDHLTGYAPRENEDRPREAARMGGSYGDVAIGVSRRKELTMVVSKRRGREGPTRPSGPHTPQAAATGRGGPHAGTQAPQTRNPGADKTKNQFC